MWYLERVKESVRYGKPNLEALYAVQKLIPVAVAYFVLLGVLVFIAGVIVHKEMYVKPSPASAKMPILRNRKEQNIDDLFLGWPTFSLRKDT